MNPQMDPEELAAFAEAARIEHEAHEAAIAEWRAAHPDEVAADEAVHARVRAEMLAAAAAAAVAAGGQ